MPARPGQPFQPVLPGTGRVARKAPAPVSPEPRPAWNDRRGYVGPVPGQLVMGVRELARGKLTDHGFHRVPSSQMPGATRIVSKGSSEEPYEVDPHGYVQEGYGTPPHHDLIAGGVHVGGETHPSAADLYGTHGGRFAHTYREAADREGATPSEWGITPTDERHNDAEVKNVKAHWKSQPTVQFPTSALIHSTQDHYETEGDATQHETARTAGGSTMRDGQWKVHNEIEGSGEGRLRVEAIKDDLRSGSRVKKPIWMVKVNGRHFQLDGHHRMVAAREAGQSHVPVKLWDLDAEREHGGSNAAALAHAVSQHPGLHAHVNSRGRGALAQDAAARAQR